MKTIALTVDEIIFEETKQVLSKNKKPRINYLNEALEHYNRLQKRILLEKNLQKESKAVTESSLETLKEFEAIDYDL